MKRLFICSLCALASTASYSYAQTAVDTMLFIQNVEVSGKRFAGLSGGEWKRLQVESNLSAMTGTAAEAFRQMPSVITDIEGGITFRGSSKAALLLNGVPYGLLEEYSGDMLIQLPALFFDRISATSYPSITRVPDGDAGLLNLTSTVQTAEDSPLSVTLGAGLQERYNAGAVVNLHPGRFHIIGKYNYRREYRERSFRKSTTTPMNRTEMNNNASARPDVHLADLRLGYDVTDHDLVTVYGLYSLMDYDRYGRINNRVFNPQGEQKKYVIRNRYNDQRQEAYAVETSWRHTFARPGELLDVRFNYNNFAYDENNDFKNENPKTGAIVAEDNLMINREKHNYFWSVGYQSAVVNNWSFKAGYIGRLKDESYLTDANNKTDKGWVSNPNKTYGYDFQRSLNLFYASAQKQWNDFTVEAGVQGELSHQKVEEVKENNFRLYPRVRFDYDLHQGSHVALSYHQRTVRPQGAFLSPYVDYSDATHLVEGNPSLKDEFVHVAELNYQLDLPSFRFSTGLFYRNRQDRMMEVAYQKEENTFWKKENVGDSQTFGWDMSAGWSPLRFLSVGISGEIYRDEIDGRTVGYGEKKSMVCGDVKGNVNIHLTPTTELQMDAFYISDQLTPQGKIKDHYSVNVGVSQYFMNRKLRANLSVNNLFDSLGETTIIDTEKLQMTQVRDRDARVAWLTLTYSL